jgi:hypothetical protein
MSRRRIIVSLVVLAYLVLMAFAVRHVRSQRILARAVAPNGIEFVVLQRWNPHVEWFEPFRTSCYYRRPGGPWGWFYYDHEDSYWGHAKAVIDPGEKKIKIYRGKDVTVAFNWENEEYAVFKNGKDAGKTGGAEKWMPLSWDLAEDK